MFNVLLSVQQQCYALIDRCRVILGLMRDRSHGLNISPMTEAAVEMDVYAMPLTCLRLRFPDFFFVSASSGVSTRK